MRVCVICDKRVLFDGFNKIINNKVCDSEFVFYYTPENDEMKEIGSIVQPLCIKECNEELLNQFDLIISLHCKQIFPKWITKSYRCINIHPGYNPYNRGWHPHVFSIINGLPTGVTIHEMDEFIDHGPIIYREEIKIEAWDDSKTVYEKILEKELELIDEHICDIINRKYTTFEAEEGNINTKKDFANNCELSLDKTVTIREILDLLRAMSFEGYKNLWFMDENDNKVYVSAKFERE